ncbi:MAG: hypothetical protein N3F10_02495 [Candidatus Bathyarchaeota archaeon]|nr:hypothetical protein [Candidatus Bathyarchaeota archaeon]
MKSSPKKALNHLSNSTKKVSKQRGLEETCYASLTKRLRCLKEAGYIAENKKHPNPTTYELRIKAYLAMFLKENSMEDIIEQAADTRSALILLALLNATTQEEE